MITDDSIERPPALLQREESSRARGAQLLDLRAPVSRTATRSATCSEHARFLLTDCLHFCGSNVATDSDAIGSAWCVDHDAMRPRCRRVCALRHVARVASLASLQVSPVKWTSHIRRIARMPLGSRHTRSQRSTLIRWIARVSLSSWKTRVQRSSRHPRTPRTPRRERPLRRPMVCRVGGFRQRLGLPRHHLSVFHQPAISSPPPTNAPASHLLSPPSRPRAQASSTPIRTQLHR
jgi:hypothetical protein